MAYDENLANKIRQALKGAKKLEEKKMFGGIAFLVDGKMRVGVNKDDMILRCDPEKTDTLLAKKGAKPFSLSGKSKTGKAPKGWLLIGPEGTRDKKSLGGWIKISAEN